MLSTSLTAPTLGGQPSVGDQRIGGGLALDRTSAARCGEYRAREVCPSSSDSQINYKEHELRDLLNKEMLGRKATIAGCPRHFKIAGLVISSEKPESLGWPLHLRTTGGKRSSFASQAGGGGSIIVDRQDRHQINERFAGRPRLARASGRPRKGTRGGQPGLPRRQARGAHLRQCSPGDSACEPGRPAERDPGRQGVLHRPAGLGNPSTAEANRGSLSLQRRAA